MKPKWLLLSIFSVIVVPFIIVLALSSMVNNQEYIKFDKNLTIEGREFYVYVYYKGFAPYKKFICPMPISNTTCIVSANSLLCSSFVCVEYNGLVSG